MGVKVGPRSPFEPLNPGQALRRTNIRFRALKLGALPEDPRDGQVSRVDRGRNHLREPFPEDLRLRPVQRKAAPCIRVELYGSELPAQRQSSSAGFTPFPASMRNETASQSSGRARSEQQL